MTDDVSPAAKTGISLTAYALLGLGALIVVALIVALLFRTDDPRVENAVDAAEGVESAHETSLNVGWIPPAADADPATLIPQAFGGWDLESSDENAGNPAYGLTRAGRHGAYARAGAATKADLYLYPGEADDAAVVDQLRERLSDTARFGEVRFGEPALVPGAKTLRFDMAPRKDVGNAAADAGVPEDHGLIAALDGWLVFARSETEDDLVPFVAAYLAAIEADGSAEGPPAVAPGDRTGPVAPDGPPAGN